MNDCQVLRPGQAGFTIHLAILLEKVAGRLRGLSRELADRRMKRQTRRDMQRLSRTSAHLMRDIGCEVDVDAGPAALPGEVHYPHL